MLRIVNGDLFQSGADVLVNPTNIDPGYMGALASFFSERYSGLERDYVRKCENGLCEMGVVDVWPTSESTLPPPSGDKTRFVINFPTCEVMAGASKLSFVKDGLTSMSDALKTLQEAHGVTSVAIPALGCGVGGLDWNEVRKLVVLWHEKECPTGINVFLYEPFRMFT